MLRWSMWINIAQGNYLCNVGPWLADNLSFIGISYTKCYPNKFETTFHRKITCAILVLSAKTIFYRKITYATLSWSAWANTAQNNYAHNAENVGPQFTV